VKLGVFGGTFDPPHIGHLVLAEEACAQLQLDRVLWVLTQYPPHKQEQRIAPVSLRLEMLQAAITENPLFELSRVDIDRPPPHYAVDTLRCLSDTYPGAKWVYLMGEDSLRDLPLWYSPKELLDQCHSLGVMHRPEVQVDLKSIDALLPGIAEKVQWIRAPLIDVSASDIRCRISQGLPYRYFLLPEVYQIVRENQLYRDDTCRSIRSMS